MAGSLKAPAIKAILIDHLINAIRGNIIIASEVPFIAGKRWADILLIENTSIHAFEIKSAVDSLDRLKEQTTDYLDTFDYVTLVVSKKHVSEARKLITDYVGIVSFDDETGQLKQLRKPQKRLRQRKEYLLNFLWRADLLKIVRKKSPINGQAPEASYLRRKALEIYSKDEIHDMAIVALKGRYGSRYKNFLDERGQKTLIEDLPLLTTTQPELLS